MVEATQVSTIRWMDKQNMAHLHNGILFSHKLEWNLIHATIWMNPENIKWNKSVTKEHIIYDSIYVWCLEQANS